MTAYKESGIKWLGKIPAHWEIKPLKYLGFLYSGLSGKKGKDFSKDKIQDFKPYIPFINICKNHYLDNELLHYVKIEENETQNKVLKYDLFFMTSSETKEEIGKNAIYLGDEKELYLNSFCRGFRFTSNEINPLFINYLLSSKTYRYYFSSSSNGDIRINLKKEIIENLLVLLPPLEEQKKIADFLDKKLEKIDYFIAKQTKFIELLKEQKQVLINQTITKGLNKSTELKEIHIPRLGKIPAHWEVMKLKYVCSSSGSNLTLKEIYEEQDKKEYPVFGASGIVGSLGTYQQEKECIGIVKDGAGVGRVFLLPKYSSILATLNYLHHCDSFLNINFFYYLLNTINFMDFVQNSTIPHIYFKDYSELFIALPPLEEQEKIAKYLDEKCEKIDKAINNITKQISLIQEYKTSLIDTTTKGMLKELK